MRTNKFEATQLIAEFRCRQNESDRRGCSVIKLKKIIKMRQQILKNRLIY